MNYEYKFLQFKSGDFSAEQIQEELSKLGAQGWKVLNFHPTSDLHMGSKGIFGQDESWDVGYVFLLVRETP